MTQLLTGLLRALLPLAFLGLAAAQAHAAAYTLPGALPPGCTASAGTYTCSALTLGNNDTLTLGAPLPATINVTGNFNTGNRPFINTAGAASDLSINVTGSVSVGNQGQINGALTATGALNLGNSTAVSRCVRSSSSATISLGNNASVGGVCCGAPGSCTSSCVVNNSGSPMPALCSASPSPSTPGRFNAFEPSTAAGSVSGVIRTKIAGSALNVAVVAVDTTGTGVASGFTGNVRVELLDSSSNTGAMNASTGCRSSWTVASGTTASTASFAASDNGRKNVTLNVASIWRDARVRISYPATGTATVVGCSNDNFAIRPASFNNVRVTDANWQTAGTTRNLDNGSNVHKAGRPFTVRATAINGAGATSTTYTGTAVGVASACTGTACGGAVGALALSATAAAGQINFNAANYAEAGAFSLQLVDTSFAAVDALDGSTSADINISSTPVTVGRFVPNHLEIVAPNAPVLRTFGSSTCATRSFTYFGQPFDYHTAPQATVLARSYTGTATASTTTNYPNARLEAITVGQSLTLSPAATAVTRTPATPTPTITANGNGSARIVNLDSDRLTLVRPSTQINPLNATLTLAWSASVQETGTGVGSGTGSISTAAPLLVSGIGFDVPNEFRYGVLKLSSAYGSELINLAVPVELQYWNGSTFATNAQDSCTTLPLSSLALGTYRGNLAACETAPGSASVVFTNGRGLLRMLPPGSGNAGSVDATINLGAVAAGQQCPAVGGAASATAAVTAGMPWLQGKQAAAAAYNQNPAARISFGQYRSPLIHLREVY